MGGFKKLKVAKQMLNTMKDIKNCPYCNQRQNEIKQHVAKGHSD